MKLIRFSFLTLAMGCVLSCAEPIKSPKQIISKVTIENPEIPVFHTSHEPKKQDAPFSDAVQVGTTFYLSGQIGMNHATRELVEGGIAAETKQTLENIKEVLAHHNLEMKDVVKTTVILGQIEDFSVFNNIYIQYFPQKPARTTFAANGLARGAKIEIEVVAVSSKQLAL